MKSFSDSACTLGDSQQLGHLHRSELVEECDLDSVTLDWQLGLTPVKAHSFPFPRVFGRIFKHNEFVLIARKPSV